MTLAEWVQRLASGRTRAENVATAEREAIARDMREAAREGRCYVIHAPEINAGYCETHKFPVYQGHTCDAHP